MDLFDSATPEQKRKRNQKKDNSVLREMVATSLDVEPAEISYHPNGEFRASRDIFGPLSTENSPVSTSSYHLTQVADPQQTRSPPSPKKRRTRKSALGDFSTNAPRL